MTDEPQPPTSLTRRAVLATGLAAAVVPPGAPSAQPFTAQPLAWEAFRRGAALYRTFTPQANVQARAAVIEALAHDEAFARGYALLAATYRQESSGWWSADPDASEALAWRWATHAVQLANAEAPPRPSLPHALEQLAWVLVYRERHAEALAAAEEAVAHDPLYADGYAVWAAILTYLGQPGAALRQSYAATQRHPHPPFFYDYHRGQAYYVWGSLTERSDPLDSQRHFRQAQDALRAALAGNARFRPARSYLVAALSALGLPDAAAREMAVSGAYGEPLFTHLRGTDETRAREHVRRITPYTNPAIRERLWHVWQAAATARTA
jgi:adenylate cyclase